jgi:hypothetical protein
MRGVSLVERASAVSAGMAVVPLAATDLYRWLVRRTVDIVSAAGRTRPALNKEVEQMKRIVVLFTVVALMVGMLAMSVAPAFAYGAVFRCTNPDTGLGKTVLGSGKHQAKLDGFTDCVRA